MRSYFNAGRRSLTSRPSTDSKVLLHTVKSEIPKPWAAHSRACTCSALTFLRTRPGNRSRLEYETVWQTLDGRPIESLIDLPLMADPEMQAAMTDMLSALLPAAYFTNFALILLVRMPHRERSAWNMA